MFFKKSKESQKIVLFDIRSSSVAGAIVIYHPEKALPEIIFSHREHYYFEESPEPEEFINRTELVLKKLCHQISHFKSHLNIPHKISQIHINYGSPWYTPELVEIKYSQSKEFTITQKLINHITSRVKIEEDWNGQEVMEKHLAGLSINGYRKMDPVGHKAKKISLSYYLSKIHLDTKREIEKIIDHVLPTERIFHHSHAKMFNLFLNHNFEKVDDYILFDVSGEITEMSYVLDGSFINYFTVPAGFNFFTRNLRKMCGYDSHTAQAHLHLYTHQKLDEQCHKKTKDSLIKTKDHWLQILKKSVGEQKIKEVPNNIFIVSDMEASPLVAKLIDSHDGYAGSLMMPRRPHLTYFNHRSFGELVNYHSEVKHDNIISILSNVVNLIKE